MSISLQNTGKSTRRQYGPAQCCGLMRDIRDTRDSGDGGWCSVEQKCWNAVTIRGDTIETLYTLYTGHLTAAPQYCHHPAEGAWLDTVARYAVAAPPILGPSCLVLVASDNQRWTQRR